MLSTHELATGGSWSPAGAAPPPAPVPEAAAATSEARRTGRRARLVVGTTAVAWVLFGGRWGSHVGFGGVYVTDVLLALGLFTRLLRGGRGPDEAIGGARLGLAVGRAPVVMVAILILVVGRLVLGLRLDAAAVRDVAPYLYCAVGLLTCVAVGKAAPRDLKLSATLVRWALVAHLGWCFWVLYVDKTLPDRTPVVDGIPIFSLRGDFDPAMAGIAGALLVHGLLTGTTRTRILPLVGIAASGAVLVGAESRAGVLGALLALSIAVWRGLGVRQTRSRRAGLGWVLAPMVLMALIAVVPQTTAGARLSAVLPGAGPADTATAQSGRGTAEARAQTWRYLLDYSVSDSERFVYGVGFGPDFMSDTDAGRLLVGRGFNLQDGDTATRSPHNYWIGSLIRLGVVGMTLLLLLGFFVLRRGFARGRPQQVGPDLDIVASLLAGGLLIPASLGVVLETPFGALPYFWSAGILYALWPRRVPKQLPVDHSAIDPARLDRLLR